MNLEVGILDHGIDMVVHGGKSSAETVLKKETKTTSYKDICTATGRNFPYTGIFGPGGFLATFKTTCIDQDEQNADTEKDKFSAATSAKEDQTDIDVHRKRLLLQTGYKQESKKTRTVVLAATYSYGRDLPSHEIAITLDHVLEQIFTSLKIPDLLNCRLVSHRWNAFATPQLEKLVEIKFIDFKLNRGTKSFSLKDFTSLFQQSNTFPFPFQFPCSKFRFDRNYKSSKDVLSDPTFQTFLCTHGINIQELSIQFASRQDTLNLRNEMFAMEYIRNLLVHQTPNLNFLSLCMSTPFCSRPLRRTDPEFNEIHSEYVSNEYFKLKLNTKLKVLEMPAYVSSKILEVIILISPNLQEIITYDRGYMYLLEPLNRLCFVKKLRCNLVVGRSTPIVLETFEQIASASEEGNMKLRDIIFRLQDHQELQEFKSRIVNFMNMMLECSWDSLETINWDGVTFLDGFKWPNVLPKVRKLELGSPFNLHGDYGQRNGRVFPPEFNLSQIFPNLRCVCLYDRTGCVGFSDFVNSLSLNFGVIESVRTVHIKFWNERQMEPITPENYQLIQKLFPRAQVSF